MIKRVGLGGVGVKAEEEREKLISKSVSGRTKGGEQKDNGRDIKQCSASQD